jgi:hypothetical protein
VSVKTIQKLASLHAHFSKRVNKSKLKECRFRLDLVDANFKQIQKIFCDFPFTIKKGVMLNNVMIKGEGAGIKVLDFLAIIADKLSNKRCKVVRARVMNATNDYYLSVLNDRRIIIDID